MIVVLASARGFAQPRLEPRKQSDQPVQESTRGFIGQDAVVLEIDNCAKRPEKSEAEIRRIAEEHYNRGETLYVQGDWSGTIIELVESYCLTPYYWMLKDIGTAHERLLEYQKAIGYYDRYVMSVPRDAKPRSACDPDPQDDKIVVMRRSDTLRKLRAKIVITTEPPARITLRNALGTAAIAASGQVMYMPAGTYQMVIERDGFQRPVQAPYDYIPVVAEIGEPFTAFIKLEPQKGHLLVRVVPGDARLFLDKQVIGSGTYQGEMPTGHYTIRAEAEDRVAETREIDVLPDRDTNVSIELKPQPQAGRYQLLAYAAGGGAVAGALIGGAQSNGTYVATGFFGGAAAGLAAAWYGPSRNIALGTSSLTITSSLIGGGVGASLGAAVTSNGNVISPLIGGGLVIGGLGGYYAGEHWHVSPGDAAMINSGALWGTVAGALFTVSFQDAGRREDAGIIMSGLAMGTTGGVLLERYFTISRGHAALIDASGVAGLLAGVAAEGVVNRITNATTQRDERTANYALGGMATGLIIGGILLHNVDEPKLAITPAIGGAKTAAGSTATTLGFTGVF